MRPDTETLQQTISQVPRRRTISDSEETVGATTVDGSYSINKAAGRKEVAVSDRILDSMHKSKSQGNLINSVKGNALSAPANRTQVHKLINRRAKKGLNRTNSAPGNESPAVADRLLEMPFEEMAIRGRNSPRRHTIHEDSAFDSSCENGPKVENTQGIVESQNVATANVFNKYHQVDSAVPTEYSDGICLDCLRNGNKCIDCGHKMSRPVSIDEVAFEGSDISDSKLYNRQFSDILLIPGPFDYHDKIGSIEDGNSV